MRVTSLVLRNFRGVRGPLTIDFVDAAADGTPVAHDHPRPVLIYGANSSGKSSICDALEFALRGVISRRSVGGVKERREIRNLFGGDPPSVTVRFDTRDPILRGARDGGDLVPARSAAEGFEHCPVVVRRSAVEGFWQVSAEQRLDFFWDYLKPPEQGWRTADEEVAVARHQAELDRLVGLEAEIRADLIPPDYNMPGTALSFVFPRHHAGSGALQHAAQAAKRASSGRRDLAPEEQQLLESYREQLRIEESLRQAAVEGQAKVVRPYRDLSDVLSAAAPRVAADFAVVSGLTWVEGVDLEVTDGAQLAVWLRSGKDLSVDPVRVLSEAYLDLLALLIILEVHVECVARGQHPVLVLDDVFQSVDAPLRQRALRQICGRLEGWQVVMTVHDRMWLELASQLLAEQDFGRAKVLELRHGGHGRTPTVTLSGTGPLRDVHFVMNNGGSAVLLAAAAGRALEALMDQLSVNLRCKLVRQHPERYMIQMLLDAVAPVLKNCAVEQVRTLSTLVKRAQFLRNAVGAHFNLNAEGVSEQEVTDAAQHVVDLWESLTCGTCGQLAMKGENDPSGRWTPRYSCRHPTPAPPVQTPA